MGIIICFARWFVCSIIDTQCKASKYLKSSHWSIEARTLNNCGRALEAELITREICKIAETFCEPDRKRSSKINFESFISERVNAGIYLMRGFQLSTAQRSYPEVNARRKKASHPFARRLLNIVWLAAWRE